MFTKYADWSSEEKNLSAESNILRLSVGAITTIATDEIIAPSKQHLDIVGAEFEIDATEKSFRATNPDGTFELFTRGLIFKLTGSTSNDGLWRVTSQMDDNGITVEAIDDGVDLVDEAGVVADFSASNNRSRHRAFGFDKAVVIKFNGDANKIYNLAQGAVLYLTESMVYFSIDVDARIYWSY